GAWFEARYLGERGFTDRIDGDSRTCPLEPIAPAGDGTDRGHAGAADIFEVDLCTGHGLGPRCLARWRRPKLTRGRRRFSDTRRLSTAACHPGRPRLPDRLPAVPRQTSRVPVPAGSRRPREPATRRAVHANLR